MDTDGLVLWYQGISSNSAEYAPMHFQLFVGSTLDVLEFFENLLQIHDKKFKLSRTMAKWLICFQLMPYHT